MPRRTYARALLIPAGVVALGLAASACGDDDSSKSSSTPKSSSKSTSSESTTTAAATDTTSDGNSSTLMGTVGPGFDITLTDGSGEPVDTVPAGTYTIKVSDKSEMHNFHLTGEGVDETTTVPDQGDTTWTVDLKAGTYTYVCDPHSQKMQGSFTVT